MLSSGLRETETGKMKIDDAKPAVVKAMLRYFYSRSTQNIDEIARELFVLADKYEITQLAVCFAFYILNCSKPFVYNFRTCV